MHCHLQGSTPPAASRAARQVDKQLHGRASNNSALRPPPTAAVKYLQLLDHAGDVHVVGASPPGQAHPPGQPLSIRAHRQVLPRAPVCRVLLQLLGCLPAAGCRPGPKAIGSLQSTCSGAQRGECVRGLTGTTAYGFCSDHCRMICGPACC